jgi:hypothetical protein
MSRSSQAPRIAAGIASGTTANASPSVSIRQIAKSTPSVTVQYQAGIAARQAAVPAIEMAATA